MQISHSPFFEGLPHFSMIFGKIIKFHDFSMTGKTIIIFPGFPGVLGTLELGLDLGMGSAFGFSLSFGAAEWLFMAMR